MVGNVENALAMNAVAQLYEQLKKFDKKSISGYTQSGFYEALSNLTHPSLKIVQVKKGTDLGKLTLERKIDDKWESDKRITPVDCYNLQKEGEDIAETVRRIYN